MLDPTRRTRLVAAVAVGVVLLGGLAAAAVVDGDGDGDDREVGVRAGGPATSTTSTTSTTTTSTTIAVATSPPPPPTSVAPPMVTTTMVTTTMVTTTVPPAPSFAIEPSAGPARAKVRAFGTGCLAPDGGVTGVSLTFFDPSGQPATGDGTSARPDGSWEHEFGFPAGAPGDWTIEAACRPANGPTVLFTYPQRATYRLT
ncbi:MAG TPA: hypothetical protein VFV35_08045 [Acidimicrobiales bacterium]|nr:hypothetical protein [Acidimicrobiales bacterium]